MKIDVNTSLVIIDRHRLFPIERIDQSWVIIYYIIVQRIIGGVFIHIMPIKNKKLWRDNKM